MATIRAFIFDLDGVIANTAEMHFRAWKRVADEEDIAFDRTRNAALRGVPREESLRRLLGGRPVPPARFAAMMTRKNQYYQALIATLAPRDIAPGAAALLGELRVAGLRLALASASRNAQQVVDRLSIRDWFDVIADGTSVENAKPAPDLFVFTARLLGVDPETCVVVEDAVSGLEAARAAAMRSVAFGPDVADAPADVHVPTFVGLTARHLLQMCAKGRRRAEVVDVFAGAELGTR